MGFVQASFINKTNGILYFFISKAENNRQFFTFDPAVLAPSHFCLYLLRFWTIFCFLADSSSLLVTFALLASSGALGAQLDDSSQPIKNQWFFTLLPPDPPKRCRVSAGHDLASLTSPRDPFKYQQKHNVFQCSGSGAPFRISKCVLVLS